MPAKQRQLTLGACMQQQLNRDALLVQTEDRQRHTRPSVQTRLTLIVMLIARGVTAARQERDLPWYHHPSASQGL
jgi:hypothetical protein